MERQPDEPPEWVDMLTNEVENFTLVSHGSFDQEGAFSE